MGSLMAGWDSPVFENPDTFRAERNRSLTKEEIQSFWMLHKKPEEEEEEVDGGTEETVMKHYSSSAPSAYKDSFLKNWPAARKQLASSDSPRSPRSPKTGASFEPDGSGNLPVQPANESGNKTGDWWTRSNWAFLNEPPQERNDDAAHKYRPQFDVARIATAGRA